MLMHFLRKCQLTAVQNGYDIEKKGYWGTGSGAPCESREMMVFLILAGIIGLAIIVAIIAAIASVVSAVAFVQKNPGEEE